MELKATIRNHNREQQILVQQLALRDKQIGLLRDLVDKEVLREFDATNSKAFGDLKFQIEQGDFLPLEI